MSPQPSNRQALLEAALECIERQGYAAVRTRDIASAANANLASIGYHFGSKDELLGEAMKEGFARWTAELAAAAGRAGEVEGPAERLRATVRELRVSFSAHGGLAMAFLETLARAPRDDRLRSQLAESYDTTRGAIAQLFELGDDQVAIDVASILMAVFDGLLIQWFLDGTLPDEERLLAAADRLERLQSATR